MISIDEAEFARVVRLHGSAVLRFARSQLPSMQDAEDVYQETFRTLFRSSQQFEDDEHLRRWLFAVASNHCKHFYRTQMRKGFDALDPQSPSFQGLIDGKRGQACPDYTPDHEVWEYVNHLPRDQREVIELFYVEGYSAEEIASIVQVRPATVRGRLFRARHALKKTMEKGGWASGLRKLSPRNTLD